MQVPLAKPHHWLTDAIVAFGSRAATPFFLGLPHVDVMPPPSLARLTAGSLNPTAPACRDDFQRVSFKPVVHVDERFFASLRWKRRRELERHPRADMKMEIQERQAAKSKLTFCACRRL